MLFLLDEGEILQREREEGEVIWGMRNRIVYFICPGLLYPGTRTRRYVFPPLLCESYGDNDIESQCFGRRRSFDRRDPLECVRLTRFEYHRGNPGEILAQRRRTTAIDCDTLGRRIVDRGTRNQSGRQKELRIEKTFITHLRCSLPLSFVSLKSSTYEAQIDIKIRFNFSFLILLTHIYILLILYIFFI